MFFLAVSPEPFGLQGEAEEESGWAREREGEEGKRV